MRPGWHDTIGKDLVSHCVNDILVQGARPLFFLDYFGTGKLEPGVAADVVKGLAEGCREAGCALIGGETAEMPGLYAAGEYDLAGCIVGLVERAKIVDGSGVTPGDVVLGLASDGLHTNGYSLARQVLLDDARMPLDAPVPELDGVTLGEALLWPHRCYAPAVLPLLDLSPAPIKAMAHITGGGFVDNIPRVLPPGIGVQIDKSAWDVPPLFRLIQEKGGVVGGRDVPRLQHGHRLRADCRAGRGRRHAGAASGRRGNSLPAGRNQFRPRRCLSGIISCRFMG